MKQRIHYRYTGCNLDQADCPAKAAQAVVITGSLTFYANKIKSKI